MSKINIIIVVEIIPGGTTCLTLLVYLTHASFKSVAYCSKFK